MSDEDFRKELDENLCRYLDGRKEAMIFQNAKDYVPPLSEKEKVVVRKYLDGVLAHLEDNGHKGGFIHLFITHMRNQLERKDQ